VIKLPALSGGSGMIERVDHPTQKPLVLCDKLIKSAKPAKDGVVLVPFAGSGSECVAAVMNHMNFIGFEINQKYIDIANARLASYCDASLTQFTKRA
jgi:site-specific DNA-methyltransferase (adenine-specific)